MYPFVHQSKPVKRAKGHEKIGGDTMRIQDLEAFLAVNKFGSLSAAAQNLYIAQPTLSNQIKALEAELEVQLIYRSRGVRTTALTPAGLALVPQAEKLIALLSEIKSATSTAQMVKIRFACVQSAVSFLAPVVNACFRDYDVPCSLEIRAMSTEHVYDHITSQDVDIALCCTPPPEQPKNVIADCLFSEPLVFVSRMDSPYPSTVCVRDLKLYHQILIYWHKSHMMWQRHWFGKIETPYLQIRNTSISSEYFHTPEIWTILPISVAKQLNNHFRISKLDHEPPDRPFYLASNYPPIEPYFELIKKVITETFEPFTYRL